MSAIEQDIIDQFHQLDDAGKRRILAALEQQLDIPTVSLGAWLDEASAFRQQLRATYGKGHFIESQALLDELREDSA